MTARIIAVGPFVALYSGANGQATPLTKILSIGTAGGFLTYTVPKTFVDAAGASRQSDRASIELRLTFYGVDPQVMKLAMGNLLTVTNKDDVPNLSKLAIFLLHNDRTSDNHLYIPACEADVNLQENMEKDNPTVIPLRFTFQDRNRFKQLFYQRVLTGTTSIQSAMVGQYPL